MGLSSFDIAIDDPVLSTQRKNRLFLLKNKFAKIRISLRFLVSSGAAKPPTL